MDVTSKSLAEFLADDAKINQLVGTGIKSVLDALSLMYSARLCTVIYQDPHTYSMDRYWSELGSANWRLRDAIRELEEFLSSASKNNSEMQEAVELFFSNAGARTQIHRLEAQFQHPGVGESG